MGSEMCIRDRGLAKGAREVHKEEPPTWRGKAGCSLVVRSDKTATTTVLEGLDSCRTGTRTIQYIVEGRDINILLLLLVRR